MTISSYYVDVAGSAPNWTSPSLAVDGLVSTYAYFNGPDGNAIAYFHGTDAPTTNTDFIQQLRFRMYMQSSSNLDMEIMYNTTTGPVITSEDGTGVITPNVPTAGWSDYYDCYERNNGWTWPKIGGNGTNDLYAIPDVAVTNDRIYKMEFEVTHFAQPSVGPLITGWARNHSDGAAVNSISVNVPEKFDGTSVQSGDLIIACCVSDYDNPGFPSNIWTTPSGFTKIEEAGNNTADCTCAVYYKVSTGGETSVTFKQNGTVADEIVGMVLIVENYDPDNIIDNSYAGQGSTGVITWAVTGSTMSTTVDNCLLIGFAATDGSDMMPLTEGQGNGTIIDEIIVENGGNDVGFFSIFKYWPTAGDVTNWQWSKQGSDGDARVTIAIAPATAGKGIVYNPKRRQMPFLVR